MTAQTNEDLVQVSLKTLVNLAQAASTLHLQRIAPKAANSGAYVSRFKGRGMEFDESRQYQPGDDIRQIDWKVTARSNHPHTKVFREERERPVFISVDNRAAMHFATRGVFKYVQAAKLAGLIAWTAQQQGDRIGGQLFSEHQCRELKPQSGKHGVLRFLNMLVTPQEAKTSEYTLDVILARLVEHTRPGSGIYIISDFRGLTPKAEQHLSKLARHCEVVLIMVYDPLEKSLPANQGRYRFADEKRDLVIDTSDRIRFIHYQDRFTQHQQHLEELAKKMSITFLPCDTQANPVDRLR
jgi:uncharacterized protein (DUF58 family)